jgi:hypothetical protein
MCRGNGNGQRDCDGRVRGSLCKLHFTYTHTCTDTDARALSPTSRSHPQATEASEESWTLPGKDTCTTALMDSRQQAWEGGDGGERVGVSEREWRG